MSEVDRLVSTAFASATTAASHDFPLPDMPFDGDRPRVCRWCGGNGLDPFLPSPVRTFFTCAPWFMRAYGGCTCMREHDHASLCRARPRDFLLPDVNEWNPLNVWQEDWLIEARGPEIVLSPFDLIGRSYHRVRCKRCRGTGRR